MNVYYVKRLIRSLKRFQTNMKGKNRQHTLVYEGVCAAEAWLLSLLLEKASNRREEKEDDDVDGKEERKK